MIPDDPLNRCWIELSGANPLLVAGFRPGIVAFLAFGPQSEPAIAGTGFVIGGGLDFALVLTAKHVFTEGVLKIQRPYRAYSDSALFVAPSSDQISADPTKLKALWGDHKSAELLNVLSVEYNDNFDLALCLVCGQEADSRQFKPTSFPLDIGFPREGDVVHLVSGAGFEMEEVSPPQQSGGIGHQIRLTRAISLRRGVVTGCFPNGFRQYRWPCFTTSIPAEAGMSGGLVYMPKNGEPVTACGVVSADNSSDAAREDQQMSGEAVVAATWPALSLRAPIIFDDKGIVLQKTLYRMLCDGDLPAGSGDIELIKIVEEDGQVKSIGRFP